MGLGWTLREVIRFAFVPAVACLIMALMLREPTPDAARLKPPAFSRRLAGLPPAFKLGLGLLPPGTPLALFGLFAYYGIFMAATGGVEKALVADLAPSGLRGTAFGLFNLIAGLLLLPASLLFGVLYQSIGALAAMDPARYGGKGVNEAVDHIDGDLAAALVGLEELENGPPAPWASQNGETETGCRVNVCGRI